MTERRRTDVDVVDLDVGTRHERLNPVDATTAVAKCAPPSRLYRSLKYCSNESFFIFPSVVAGVRYASSTTTARNGSARTGLSALITVPQRGQSGCGLPCVPIDNLDVPPVNM